MRAKYFYFCFGTLLFFSISIKAQWSRLEGLYGGSAGFIALDSSYLYTLNSFLYRSTDNGNSWKILKYLDNVSAKTCAVKGPNILVGVYRYTSSLFRSTDYGNTWDELNGLPNDIWISRIYFYKNKIFVAIPYRGMYSSTDNGDNWTQLAGIPTSNNIIWDITNCGNNVFAGGSSAIYKSTDEGVTWTDVFQGEIYSLASNGYNIIAAASGKFYLSTDNGGSWETNDLGSNMSSGMPICYVDSNVYYVDGGRSGYLLRSTDNGFTWIQDSLRVSLTGGILADSSIVYISTPDGILTSTDNGNNWNLSDNYGLIERDVDLIEICGTNIIAVGLDQIIEANITTDEGSTWKPITSAGIFLSILTLNDNSIIAGTRNIPDYGLYRSDNGGIDWYQVNQNTIFEMISTNTGLYAIGDTIINTMPISPKKKLMKSFNEGISWEILNNGISGYENLTLSNQILFVVKPDYYCDSLFRSVDNGNSWESVFSDSVIINSVAQIDSNIFVGTSKNPQSYAGKIGLFHSYDNGETWINILPDTEVKCLISKGPDLIIATENKILKSSDYGSTFADISEGFLGRVNSFKIKSPYLYAAASSGVWRRPLTEITDVNNQFNNDPADYDLAQNYPNPFNPSTTIKYQIPKDGIVTLKIYDILGKEVKTLVNEQKPTGRYEVKFDASELATGVYIYRIKVNDFVSVKKMVLLK